MRSAAVGFMLGACLLACSADDAGDPAVGSGATSGAMAAGPSGAGGVSGGIGGAGGALADAGGSAGVMGAIDDAGVAQDSGGAAVSRGPFDVPELPFPLETGEPIVAPERQWSYVAFPEARCANGTPTGIAISPVAHPQGLLLFMQGGGACWDATMCLETKTSVHLEDTVDGPVVLSEAGMLSGLFDHDNPENLFRDYTYVYIPYCTGDLHIGTRAKTYTNASGDTSIQHVGGHNVELYLERLVPTLPDIEHVLVTGISAGGYGVTFNWWRYQSAFPNARVDVLDDAGLIVDAKDDRWQIMVDAWGIDLPPGCTQCAQRMSAYLPFYGEHLVAPRRYALVGFLNDAVISSFFGLTGPEIEAELLARRRATADNQKTFFLAGTSHSIFSEGAFSTASDGSMFVPWLVQLTTDDPSWDHAGP